jgi:acetyl esterase/lipase
MKKSLIIPCLILTVVFSTSAQQVVRLYNGAAPSTTDPNIKEKITYAQDGSITGISDVVEPSMTVYLPDPAKATGTAVVVLPGGALRFLSWDNEGVKVAKWLNERGIAAFILKYRVYTGGMQQAASSGQQPPMTIRLTVDQFGQLNNANANPSADPQMNKVLDMAAADAREALRIIRNRAGEWRVNPDKTGYMGFSAGGGVELAAVIGNTDKTSMPAFIGSAYGPSLIDVVVPQPAPPLFIATAADHMNVAAGCLALFMAWKKAGGEAELHVYGKGKGAFGMTQQGLPSDTWIDSFYTWLRSEGF